MIKRGIFLTLALVSVLGCASGEQRLEGYLQQPETFLKDPHFTSYKEKLDALESDFLKKKITYAEYLDKKKELDETYAKEVQERSEKIIPSSY